MGVLNRLFCFVENISKSVLDRIKDLQGKVDEDKTATLQKENASLKERCVRSITINYTHTNAVASFTQTLNGFLPSQDAR